jgi:hypothetical protein
LISKEIMLQQDYSSLKAATAKTLQLIQIVTTSIQ